MMDDVVIARALHVLAVVIWIGGVAMVTVVLLPAIRRGELGQNRFEIFRAVERRFIRVARGTVIVAGLTGLYMVWRLELWNRFRSGMFWWMHAMVFVWLLFAFILFVAEPFILHRRFHRMAAAEPDAGLARLQRMHWTLLVLSVVTILGAVAGSQGWSLLP